MTTRGFITVALGKRRYLEMAVNLALSLRQYSEYSCSVVVDKHTSRWLKGYAHVFDQSMLLERGRANRSKHETPGLTPYDTTVFVDADCLAVANPDHLFADIEQSKTGIVMQGEWKRPAAQDIHHGRPVSLFCRELDLRRYLKTNSGIIGYRRQDGLRLQHAIRLAEKRYLEAPAVQDPTPFSNYFHISDEVLIGIASSSLDIDLFQNPVPNRWSLEPKYADQQVCFWHLIGKADSATEQKVHQIICALRQENGLSIRAGINATSRKRMKDKVLGVLAKPLQFILD